MLRVGLVIALAAGMAAFTYLRLERGGRRVWVPLVCRAGSWAALGLLLLDMSCPVAGTPRRPLVLLDGSLSLGAAGGEWRAARDSAAYWGDVTWFGDERPGADSVPRGRSLLGPALAAASASDRPVIIVSDGEIEDAADIPPDLLARAGIRLFPRVRTPDLALTAVTGPSRVTAGDSIVLGVDVEALGGAVADTVAVEASAGGKRLARRTLRFVNGRARGRLVFGSPALGPGEHVLRVALLGSGDREPRTDARMHLVTVTPTPGVVLLAGPADWDSRFLYRAVREVAQLPVRGFVRVEPERWRSMADLRVVPAETVRQAARRADLLILMGSTASMAEGTTARAVWHWPATSDSAALPGDWYLAPGDASPLGGAFLGQPLDSFPPAIQLAPVTMGPGDWMALTAQLGRRGVVRPAVIGHQAGRVRSVTVAVSGLWRWAFRDGSSEQAYRTWVAATASWLLGGADSARGVAVPIRPVVTNGRPVVFEWAGEGAPSPVGIAWSGGPSSAGRSDTLRFDGSGHALAWLLPGQYRYRLSGGGAGTVVVEDYSDELLPQPMTLVAHQGRAPPPIGRRGARDWLWLFGICVLGFAGEWLARRRLGLR